MRILGFEKKWPKLQNDSFTTFRFPRRDNDWYVSELVQIVIKPRSKNREELGIARIVNKVPRIILPPYKYDYRNITEAEAIADGFPDVKAMQEWMWDRYKGRLVEGPMNKLTLVWERHKKATNYEEFKAGLLKKPQIHKEYEALNPKYDMIRSDLVERCLEK